MGRANPETPSAAIDPQAIGNPLPKTLLKDLLMPKPKESAIALTRLAVLPQHDVNGHSGWIPAGELCGLEQVANVDICLGQGVPYEKPLLGRL
jgi:hypothetical protein